MAILKYSVKFNLQHNINKNKDTAIRCIVRFNNERAPFGTNVRINTKYWDIKKQEAKISTTFDGSSINDKLNSIKDFVKDEFEKLDSYPDPDNFKELCVNFIGASPVEEIEELAKIKFISFFSDLIIRMESGEKRAIRGKRAGQKYSSGTVKGYETVLKIFKGFAIDQKKEDFDFDEVDNKFYDRLQNYFYSLDYSSGYFATIVKTLKSVMNVAKTEEHHSNEKHLGEHFVKPAYESDTIYLNVEQLDAINRVEFDDPDLRRARDIFLIGCWTGLRFSDFSELTLDDIDGDYIRVLTGKTQERVTIPCHPVIKAILKRNGGDFPPKMTSQDLNKKVKVIAIRAKLSKRIIFKSNKGGVDVFNKVDFCSLVTTHTARRSFATNIFKLGIPTFVIMAITGHKTESAFFRYIRVSNEEKAQIMRGMWERLGVFKQDIPSFA